MSFFSFLSHKKEKKALVFDISSGTVGGAIVVFNENSLPKVIKSKREIIPFNVNIYGKKLQASTILALKRLCKDLSYHSGKINEVHLVLSSPWVNSETKILSTKNTKPFLITQSFIDALIEEEEKNFEKKFATDQNKPELKKDIIQIEKNMTDIRLNGYSVEDPINKKANVIEVPIFSSITLKSVIKEFQKTIRDSFTVNSFSIHSMSMLSFLFLRDTFDHDSDFSFINVHGEVTEILAASKNHLSGISVIPIGTRTIIRKFSEKNKKSHHLAASEISMYASGALINTVNDSSSEEIKTVHREWSTGVSSSLENISMQPNIPSKICITADMAMEKAFGNLVRKEVIKTMGISEESTEIFNIGDMNLSKYISNESSGVTDDILLLCTLGVYKVKKNI